MQPSPLLAPTGSLRPESPTLSATAVRTTGACTSLPASFWATAASRSSIRPTAVTNRWPTRSGAWIVFNGEIYNFRELQKELESRGRRFLTRTDTEVILQAYLEWDVEAVSRFNGMFALAIWDVQRKRLWLARDPVGIKPLFYSDRDGVLRFGSEVKAVLADPAISGEADLSAVNAFLSFGYVPAPRTGFAGIAQLPPGHSLVAEAGRILIGRYFALPYPDEPPDLAEAEAIDCFRHEFVKAVRRQMVSDVPMGAFERRSRLFGRDLGYAAAGRPECPGVLYGLRRSQLRRNALRP